MNNAYLNANPSRNLPKSLFALPLKALVNHKQPNGEVAGGYLRLTPEQFPEPAPPGGGQVAHAGEDKVK